MRCSCSIETAYCSPANRRNSTSRSVARRKPASTRRRFADVPDTVTPARPRSQGQVGARLGADTDADRSTASSARTAQRIFRQARRAYALETLRLDDKLIQAPSVDASVVNRADQLPIAPTAPPPRCLP